MEQQTKQFEKEKRFTILPRTNDVYEARKQANTSKMLNHYAKVRMRNILIWSLIFIEPISNVIAFMSVYFSSEKDSAAQFAGWVGMWVSIGVLAAYIIAYIPIILGNKIWVYTYQKTLIIVYVGIIRCHLVVDEKLWDKKPKKSHTYLYGVTKDGQKIEVFKDGMACKISMDTLQKPIIPVI